MYKRTERTRIEMSWELLGYQLSYTMVNFVQDDRTFKLFKDATEAHKLFNEKRFDIISKNIEIVKNEIAQIETVGREYENECNKKLVDFHKAISKLSDDIKSQMKINEPKFEKFGGSENCDQLLIILNAELLELQDDLKKYELRLKILNHNIKTVNELYG